ncbi:WD40-repeat-containing domain protein [Suillus subalutaceus]|uniref:WD40-repeat-containing domain protein n=1 Tax=Suillus subalutaceus TaxID=48586 RepID=UPI001B85C3D8|nr:WD40-repeat-containing domain protein [Suillus subalutaceus]KAG1855190.1 WD40-repeat-containing domain protein [Suillus subalutaceus]
MSTMGDVARNVLRTVRESRRMKRGHTGEVKAVVFFKDSRRVVTCSDDTTLRIWDVQKGALVGGPFEGHRDWVRSCAISPDDRRIASGGRDKRIIIWDVESKQMVFEPLVEHTHWVESVCFSPNGKRLASGSQDCTVIVWNAETGTVITTLDGHRGSVWSVAFSPDGLKLASGSSDCTIRIWHTVNAEILFEINAHKNPVRSVVWSSDGQQLVSASYGTVKFWNSSNGVQDGLTCTGHTDWVRSLAISSDNSFIAAASDDKTVRLWSTTTHQSIGQAIEHSDGLLCVAISPDGKWLVSGDNQGRVWFWSLKNILKQQRLPDRAFSTLSNSNLSDLAHSEIQPSDGRSTINNPQTHEASSSKSRFSFDFLATNTTVPSAGSFHTSEELPIQEIDDDGNHSDSYANLSIMKAQISDWDNALQDADKSISIRPSLMGYISKGIALCGSGQLWGAMEAFDLASVFSNRDPMTIDLLLLIKAVALFNASHHDEAIRRVQGLATVCQQLDTLPCTVVDSYLRVQLAIIDFRDGRYSEAADKLTASIATVTRLVLRTAHLEPRLKIFKSLFGWDLDSLWQTVNQTRCNAFLHAGRLIEAVESHQYMISMISMIDDVAKDGFLDWSTGNYFRIPGNRPSVLIVVLISLQARLHCALYRKGTGGCFCE